MAAGILRDADEARNVTQDALVRIMGGLPGLRQPAQFGAWMHRIVVNTAYSHLRSAARERDALQLFAREERVLAESPAEPIADDESFSAWIEPLDEQERTIVALRFIAGMEFSEIADVLGLKLSAAKMRFYRAIAKLRCEFTEDEQQV